LAVTNVGQFAQIVDTNERIAQGIFTKYLVVDGEEKAEKKPKEKRKGGIGSTNKAA
jgi:dUTPase